MQAAAAVEGDTSAAAGVQSPWRQREVFLSEDEQANVLSDIDASSSSSDDENDEEDETQGTALDPLALNSQQHSSPPKQSPTTQNSMALMMDRGFSGFIEEEEDTPPIPRARSLPRMSLFDLDMDHSIAPLEQKQRRMDPSFSSPTNKEQAPHQSQHQSISQSLRKYPRRSTISNTPQDIQKERKKIRTSKKASKEKHNKNKHSSATSSRGRSKSRSRKSATSSNHHSTKSSQHKKDDDSSKKKTKKEHKSPSSRRRHSIAAHGSLSSRTKADESTTNEDLVSSQRSIKSEKSHKSEKSSPRKKKRSTSLKKLRRHSIANPFSSDDDNDDELIAKHRARSQSRSSRSRRRASLKNDYSLDTDNTTASSPGSKSRRRYSMSSTKSGSSSKGSNSKMKQASVKQMEDDRGADEQSVKSERSSRSDRSKRRSLRRRTSVNATGGGEVVVVEKKVRAKMRKQKPVAFEADNEEEESGLSVNDVLAKEMNELELRFEGENATVNTKISEAQKGSTPVVKDAEESPSPTEEKRRLSALESFIRMRELCSAKFVADPDPDGGNNDE